MMRYVVVFFIIFTFISYAYGTEGRYITYQINGKPYEGYYVIGGKECPLVLLIHDWDGITNYEIKRAHMLSKLGYNVFVADLFGAGIRPTTVTDKRQHTGELN